MTKLEILQADYNTLSRTVVRLKCPYVLLQTQRRFPLNALAFFEERKCVFSLLFGGDKNHTIFPFFTVYIRSRCVFQYSD